ncbi:unnamed protein product, partial [Allacma fusca]
IIQKKTKPVLSSGGSKLKFNFKKPGYNLQDKSCTEYCLPACAETSYSTVVTSAAFPNQNEPNKTKMLREAIADNRIQLNDINYCKHQRPSDLLPSIKCSPVSEG